MGHRFYDPVAKRFLTPDIFLMENVEELVKRPFEMNLYGYAGNNPISLTDPSGDAGLIVATLTAITYAARHANVIRKADNAATHVQKNINKIDQIPHSRRTKQIRLGRRSLLKLQVKIKTKTTIDAIKNTSNPLGRSKGSIRRVLTNLKKTIFGPSFEKETKKSDRIMHNIGLDQKNGGASSKETIGKSEGSSSESRNNDSSSKDGDMY